MTLHLSVVLGDGRSAPTFAPPPLLLDERTQRPGELADFVPLALDREVAARVQALADGARLPLALYVVVAVEAQHVLTEVAAVMAIQADDLACALDLAAAETAASRFEPPASRPLCGYARALRSSGYKGHTRRELDLVVPDRLRARWSLVAQEAGLTVEAWIVAQLTLAAPGRELWEAQAASEARTLGEWIALQALRRARRSSTSAQASASD
jgi:hypothetical protein